MTMDPLRVSRFSTIGEPSGVQSGYGGPGENLYDRAFIIRNLKPYESLSRYASAKGLRKLRGMKGNYQRIENIAARAVLKDAGVKRRGLRVQTDRDKFGRPLLQRAAGKLEQGYDIRRLGQTGADIMDIKRDRLRQATRHLSTVRRNRRIMSTDPYAGRGYDIRMGHQPGPRPDKRYRLGL